MTSVEWNRDELYRLYWLEGLTVVKIGELYGRAGQTVQRAMLKLNIPRRRVGFETGRKIKEEKWTPPPEYQRGHRMMDEQFGKPRYCEKCKRTDHPRYDWANISGNFLDPLDYMRLCRICHKNYDMQKRRVSS